MDKTTSNRPQAGRENRNHNTRSQAGASIRAVKGEGNERRRVLSFSSEEPYERRFGAEVLDHSAGAMVLDRLNTIGCLLFNHDRDQVIGRVVRAWVEDNRGMAEVEFDSDSESERIFNKVATGTLKGVSVGYRVYAWEDVAAGKTTADGKHTGPCAIARKWEPLEISVVSVPADASVGMGRAADTQTPGNSLALARRRLAINRQIMEGITQ